MFTDLISDWVFYLARVKRATLARRLQVSAETKQALTAAKELFGVNELDAKLTKQEIATRSPRDRHEIATRSPRVCTHPALR